MNRRIASASRTVTKPSDDIFVHRPLAVALALAFAAASPAVLAQLPTGGTVVNGSAGIVTNGNQMTISNSPNAILNWQTFSVGTQNGVRFDQQNASSQVLNRVLGNDPSSILGSLSSNGRVWLVNPHGVLFGPNARIDVGGLVASTLGISNDDFLAGRFKFENAGLSPAGKVLSQGEITTSFGGRVWLIGDTVQNEGLIQAPGGDIVLAAGKSIELVDSGAPHVIVRVTAPENEAVNLGTLIASGSGSIDVHGGIVNQQGIVRADSIGTDAAGRIVIKSQGNIKLGDSSITSASATGSGSGGSILAESATGDTLVTGQVAATSGADKGGNIQLLGHNVGLYKSAVVDASGAAGGGQVLVGGDYQGKNPAISNATATYLGPDATVKVNATEAGDGGRVILWGNDATRVYGRIEARGGPQGGDGGLVETSGGFLDVQPKTINVEAPKGKAGTWLLDPNNITIMNFDGDGTNMSNNGATPNFMTSTNDSSVVSAGMLSDRLDSGTSVIIRTGTAGTNSQAGDIVVANDIITVGEYGVPPGSLTLQAHRDITVNPGVAIRSTTGPMPVTLTSDFDGNNTGAIQILSGATIDTDGGNIVLQGGGALGSATGDTGISIGGAFLAAGSGTIRLRGVGRGATDSGSGAGVRIHNGSTLDASTIDIRGEANNGSGVAISDSSLDASTMVIAGDTSSSAANAWGVVTFRGAALSGDQVQLTSGSSVGVTTQDNNGQGTASSVAGNSVSLSASRVRIFGGTVSGGDVRVSAGDFLLEGALVSDAANDAIVVVTDRFTNSQGTIAAPSGRWLIYSRNPAADAIGGLAYDFVQFNAPAFTTPALATNGLLYSDPLNVTAKISREYDGTTRALFGPYSTDLALRNVRLVPASSDLEGTFQDKNVGVDKPISLNGELFRLVTDTDKPVFGNTASYVGDITAKSLSATGITAANKVYDGNRLATLSIGAFSGLITGDSVSLDGATGTFDTKNVGTSKIVTIEGGALSGVDAGNYILTGPLTTTADITPKPISLGAITAANKVYDGNRIAALSGGSVSGLIAGDSVSFDGATGAFDTKKVGTSKIVTISTGLSGVDAGNYILTGPLATTADITAKPISVTGITAANKVYDGNRVATLSGGSLSGLIAGDSVTLDGATGTFDTKNVGTRKVVTIPTNLTGVDAGNYSLAGPLTTAADITPKPVNISIVGTVSREYDATTGAALNATQFALEGVVGADSVSVSGPTQGTYDTPNVGTQKLVTATGEFQIAGADAPNYGIASNIAGGVGTITPATLTFSADRALRELGFAVGGLTGSVSGFKGLDTAASQTSGSLAWSTLANAASPPGVYEVNGGGLSSTNYVFTQAPGNATALTLMPVNTPSAPQQEALANSDAAVASALSSAIAMVDQRAGVGLLDISSSSGRSEFGSINIAAMSQDQLARLLESRKEFKRKLFADAIYKLEIDPSLADVQPCASAVEASSGLCLITTAQVTELEANRSKEEPVKKATRTKPASLPKIDRKIGIFFGINEYADKKIPTLENAVPDVEAVSKIFAERLGYEVRVIRNPSKADIIRTLNQLSTEIESADSVVIYYAGHGYSLEKNGAGYWLPADAPTNDPTRWISNSDVAKMLAGIRSRQMAVISDSCYSGAFAREGMASVGRDVNSDDVLNKRSVVVLSSGGDEPVADEGKEGHSIFAWNLMKAVDSVQNWTPGSTIFSEVQVGVKKEFPQTPKYGSVTAAGHQQGGDYLFEIR